MKTFLRVIAIVAIFVSGRSAEMIKIDWEAMSADEIKGKVIALESFRDVTTLMGEPHSTSNSGLMSSAKYNIGVNFVLFFHGETENHLSKQDDLRKVRSVSFRPVNQMQNKPCLLTGHKPFNLIPFSLQSLP
jgi:hypothetical protein